MWRTEPRPSPPHSAGRYHYYRIDNRTDRRTVTIDYRRQTPHHQSIDLQTPYTASSLVIETRQSEESTSASEARHVKGCPTYLAAVSERILSLLARRRGHTIPKKERERARRHQAPSPHLQRVAQSSASSTYTSYREPELSDQRDKHGRRMIAYPCKLCGTRINRPTSDSSCSNLNKHALLCRRKHNESQNMQSLANLGITGTGDINPTEVPQLCAIWCAEAARPFSSWIAEAIRLAREMWVSNYKPRPVTPASSAPTTSSKPITGMLASLGRAAATRGGDSSADAFDTWLSGGLVLNGDELVNPLKWWMEQKRSGNSHRGLVHMALDVLACPATSVDVERAGMTVAFYSKNSKIQEGTLTAWKQGLQDKKKSKQKSKRKVIVLDDDEDENSFN
ncbi:hypothetical protein PGT21_017319 [Puccinia graminis f. sp. tritici]|uniref:HAT C-terminal dimerisation domain-containing protein n=1 Tax=Puccinia graminis f. sp. tritici TaxID=56615 RepID=A0A5B0PXT7_PUCGR|nr:hypothetical protein PGT21_017319 [Puccinia graminis f. sp. tritici]